MNERLQKQLDFALEIDKEKNIFRQTHLSGHGRNENDAEHAWHMAIMAYLLREYANERVNIERVMIMCLIHDIVEIDAGDTYAYDAEGRVSSKEVSKWSKSNQRFEKLYCLNFSYDGGEVNVEYVAWNSKDNAYTDVKIKAVYQINGMGVNYQSYEWNKKESSWNLMVEHSTQPEEIILFAEK